MQIQELQEVKILEKIKVKMERIKANQKKIQGVTMMKEPIHHDAGNMCFYLIKRIITVKNFKYDDDDNKPRLLIFVIVLLKQNIHIL